MVWWYATQHPFKKNGRLTCFRFTGHNMPACPALPQVWPPAPLGSRTSSACRTEPRLFVCLFSDYLYVSGTSATLQKHFEQLAAQVMADVGRMGAPPG